jgi:uncharacterized protein (DUF58 family)
MAPPAAMLATMRIAKPMLLATTPIGVAWGLLEATRFHWWLGLLMGAMLSIVGGLFWLTLRTIRVERRARPPPGRN